MAVSLVISLHIEHAHIKDQLAKILNAIMNKQSILLQVQGSVYYNGHTFDDFVIQRTAALIDQVRAEVRLSMAIARPSLFK